MTFSFFGRNYYWQILINYFLVILAFKRVSTLKITDKILKCEYEVICCPKSDKLIEILKNVLFLIQKTDFQYLKFYKSNTLLKKD